MRSIARRLSTSVSLSHQALPPLAAISFRCVAVILVIRRLAKRLIARLMRESNRRAIGHYDTHSKANGKSFNLDKTNG
jgi:hypothetical protein